ADLATLKLPTRLTRTVVSNCDSGIGPSLPSTRPAPRMPAQFTATLRPPRCSTAPSMLWRTPSSLETSVRKYFAAAPSSASAAAPRSSLMSNSATRPPWATKCRATASPSPEAPPVTTARTSERFIGGVPAIGTGGDCTRKPPAAARRPLGRRLGHGCPGGERRQLLRRPRRTEQEALAQLHPEPGEERPLFLALDALGNHLQAQAVGDADDGLADGHVRGIARHSLHEAMADLDRVDRQPTQVVERAV